MLTTVLIGGPYDGKIMQVYYQHETNFGMILGGTTYKPCQARTKNGAVRVAWVHESINRNRLDVQQIITNGIDPFTLPHAI